MICFRRSKLQSLPHIYIYIYITILYYITLHYITLYYIILYYMSGNPGLVLDLFIWGAKGVILNIRDCDGLPWIARRKSMGMTFSLSCAGGEQRPLRIAAIWGLKWGVP